jgi:hypothetical protein
MYTSAGSTIQRSPFVCITISLALHVIPSMYHEFAQKFWFFTSGRDVRTDAVLCRCWHSKLTATDMVLDAGVNLTTDLSHGDLTRARDITYQRCTKPKCQVTHVSEFCIATFKLSNFVFPCCMLSSQLIPLKYRYCLPNYTVSHPRSDCCPNLKCHVTIQIFVNKS